jgi:hypothetical protein
MLEPGNSQSVVVDFCAGLVEDIPLGAELIDVLPGDVAGRLVARDGPCATTWPRSLHAMAIRGVTDQTMRQ